MKTILLLLSAAVLAVVPACAAPPSDEDSTSEALSASDNGAGAGPARFDVDPCESPASFAKAHGYNLIVMKPGDHLVHGTSGKDFIVGTDGDDEIYGEGGNDIICAGYGEDTVHGGDGDDYIDGGGDNDTLWGDDGDDYIHGRGGSDVIHGGNGNDLLFGDILDDSLYGEAGDDLLIGGHGTDTLMGGDGNDYLRGDTGNDAFVGGAGTDVVSFITAMPPGQPDVVGKPNAITGVKVDFTDDCVAAGNVGGKTHHDGCANGDGGNEPLDGIEIVIGSPYDDVFIGPEVKFLGGYGNDKCNDAACGEDLPGDAANKVFVTMVTAEARDTGLVVIGTTSSDNIQIVQTNDKFRVRPVAGTPLYAGPNCNNDGADVVCDTSHVVRWVAAWMNDGDDIVKVAEAAGSSQTLPLDITVHVNGGNGDDWLHGGDEQDVFFTGPTGQDHLFGNNGGDALLSESRKWPKKACGAGDTDPHCDEDKPDGAKYTDGADELFGGNGDDQLVIDYPCGKHHYSGGAGKDIAGFARSGSFDIHAQLNGAATVVTAFHGQSFNPQLCGVEYATTMEDDLEILEASDGNDELWGNDKPNTIWGRKGNDKIHGLGGDDVLMGLLGNDFIYGGAGNDQMSGAPANQMFQDAN